MNFQIYTKSFKAALSGISYTWIHEKSFRIEVYTGFFVILASLLLGLDRYDFTIVFFLIGMILVLELINTLVEQMLDLFKPRIHDYVRIIKNIMAAVVLIAAVISVVVGILIFYPYLVDLLS